ncbi:MULTISPECIES: ABC transporter permease [unclassified Streptomyces]|uniref:ABC transporter permease n=1 Tax=unclassified Streptomyces TaxID=2593676 RepID=UPI00224DB600|nr:MULTISPECIES: ABC transporter permease [unclassified Streptomyces]WSU25727.1 ABC transporter permease [Streptomyces sp. NBC_01108]MCX4784998.1 ABC transporter permease [Streptomyces sp. NBC_01221]MCX4799065.1 ABC transporter permease [Streptomyces sp. NBC_01242]WSJ40253.1 ABC transporter permease [Streptomyces sp. NBC_01321]WSP66556.1 ABC transporter permease [Streptomyces sp. NBC_01240]
MAADTTGAAEHAIPHPRGGVVRMARDSWVIARRNLRRMARIPEIVVFGLMQPVMFVLLFSYVMGGAIRVPGGGYREFLMAGIFAQTVTFAVAGASAGIAEDMTKGLVDRFRSLPMARSAVLAGRTLADAVQTAFILLVLAMVALLVGWRVHHGVLQALGAFVLLLLLGYAFSWIGALIGLSVRSPEAATSAGLIWLFPLTFLSNAFVPVNTMPGWLQAIAYWNPFSATVQACRKLFGNPGADGGHSWPMRHPVEASTLWSLLILALFSWLSVRKYRVAAG